MNSIDRKNAPLATKHEIASLIGAIDSTRRTECLRNIGISRNTYRTWETHDTQSIETYARLIGYSITLSSDIIRNSTTFDDHDKCLLWISCWNAYYRVITSTQFSKIFKITKNQYEKRQAATLTSLEKAMLEVRTRIGLTWIAGGIIPDVKSAPYIHTSQKTKPETFEARISRIFNSNQHDKNNIKRAVKDLISRTFTE